MPSLTWASAGSSATAWRRTRPKRRLYRQEAAEAASGWPPAAWDICTRPVSAWPQELGRCGVKMSTARQWRVKPRAQYNLAWYYEHGKGVSSGAFWICEASERPVAGAGSGISRPLEKHVEKIKRGLTKSRFSV